MRPLPRKDEAAANLGSLPAVGTANSDQPISERFECLQESDGEGRSIGSDLATTSIQTHSFRRHGHARRDAILVVAEQGLRRAVGHEAAPSTRVPDLHDLAELRM